MTKNQEYASQFSEFAMLQMKRYGIPASVTLAQGILESSNGQSELSKLGNNHFGIKATGSWLRNGGEYLVYTDDKPNEKFCKYDSAGDSYEHHSEFLMNNKRYAECFKLSPDDYKGWTQGLEKAGYATGGGYATNLQNIIKQNDLQKYDQMVMNQLSAEGKSVGTDINTNNELDRSNTTKAVQQTKYSFPIQRTDFLLVTSTFGMRNDPLEKGIQSMHNGMDIQCKNDNLLAMEDGGKVVSVKNNPETSSGKSITIEYSREDGNKFLATYMHMSQIDVKVGDIVTAGQKVGVSGNTGTRTTGEHLHMEISAVNKDGTSRKVDPAAYLAEIAYKGNINQQLLHNGTDLLSKYKVGESEQPSLNIEMSPDDWMKKLLSSEDSGLSFGRSSDPIMEMAISLYSGLLLLATQIDNQSDEKSMQVATEAAVSQKIDISSLVPSMKIAELQMNKEQPTLHLVNEKMELNHELTSTETAKISETLGNNNLTDVEKSRRIAGVVNGIMISQMMSRIYESERDNQMSESENIQRK